MNEKLAICPMCDPRPIRTGTYSMCDGHDLPKKATNYEDDRPHVYQKLSTEIAALLAFPGGDVAIRKPTRADLMLSAKQWIDRVRDDIVDARHPGVILASLDRLDAVLVELGVTL